MSGRRNRGDRQVRKKCAKVSKNQAINYSPRNHKQLIINKNTKSQAQQKKWTVKLRKMRN
jgi:hypothetical protein